MKIVRVILNSIRYIVCLLMVLAIAFITAPLTIFFGWNGVWVLWIANEEGCSLSEARKILQEGKRYKTVENKDINLAVLPKDTSDQFTNPVYSYMNTNTYSTYHRGRYTDN